MAIRDFGEEAFQKIINENLTPSSEISTPARLYGREKALKDIARALNSRGRAVFVHGDRGVGKSSIALTAAGMISAEFNEPLRVVCSQSDTFGQIIQAIGNKVIPLEARMSHAKSNPQLGVNFAGFGVNFKPSDTTYGSIPVPNALNEALDIIRFVMSRRNGTFVVIVDEMERISSDVEREKFAELIKNIPSLDDRIKFIFCGIGTTLDELIGSHPSAGRILEPVVASRLHHDHLWKIIHNVAKLLQIDVTQEQLIRISQISDGFPSYVHLVGDSMFWSVFDDPQQVTSISREHFRAGIRSALERSEPILQSQYKQATLKTKNTVEYEEALWSLADKTSDRRQLTEIYENSYRPMMMRRTGRPTLSKEVLNNRYHALKSDNHGRIVKNYGAGWFGFRENIIRGYVRLKAEAEGIELGKDSL